MHQKLFVTEYCRFLSYINDYYVDHLSVKSRDFNVFKKNRHVTSFSLVRAILETSLPSLIFYTKKTYGYGPCRGMGVTNLKS